MTALVAMGVLATTCVSIPGSADEIVAADLAQRMPAFALAAPTLAVGLAPVPGARRIFNELELRKLAARHGVPDSTPIESEICVERSVAPLDAARLLEAMQRTLPAARIEIVDYSRHPAPEGEIEFPLRTLQPSGLWTGSVRYGRGRRFAIWARVTVKLSRTAVFAAETLIPGRPITASQVTLETTEGPPHLQAGAASVGEVVGLIPRRKFLKGSVVALAYLTRPPEITRGDSVRVEVQHGSARLELEATAEVDGRLGETISFRNPETKRQFRARVQGKGRATIDAGGRK